jgi:hypothetical protein
VCDTGEEATAMKRILGALAAPLMVLGLAAAPAAADDHEPGANLAANEAACLAAGGTYYDSGPGGDRVRTCTVGSEGWTAYGVPASHPQQEWTVDVYYPGEQTVYRLAAGEGFSVETTGGGDPYVVACYNHQGKPVDVDTTHCVPSA